MRRGGGIGWVVLLVTMAIVLVMVAKAWQRLGPSAIEVTPAAGATPPGSSAPPATSPGGLPDLKQMQQGTDAHTQRLEEALSAIE